MREDSVRFHVDLSHLQAPLSDLRFHSGIVEVPLVAHDDASRADAVRTNSAIALMPDPGRMTHYADVPANALPDDQIRRLQVTFDHGDSAFSLRGLALVATYIPPRSLRKTRQEKLSQSGGASLRHGKLLELGIGAVDSSTFVDVLAGADRITTPWDTAVTLVGSHPELGSVLPMTAARVQEYHIAGEGNLTATKNFANTIRNHPMSGRYGWASVNPCTTPSGEVMTYEVEIKGIPLGAPVEQFDLSDLTLYGSSEYYGLQTALPMALQTANDDAKLRNQTWTVAQGRPVAISPGTSPAETSSGGVNWSLLNLSPDNGLSLDNSSIKFDGTNFWITVTNGFMRTVGVYVEFFQENGTAYAPTWTSRLGSLASGLETDEVKYLGVIQPESVVMGIPISNANLVLNFPLPPDANNNLPGTFKLIFGSLGGNDYTSPECQIGAITTSIFSFGFPALFLVSGVLGASGLLTDITMDSSSIAAVVSVGIALIGFTYEVGDLGQFLKTMGGIVAGLIVNKLLTAIFTKLIALMTGEEVAKAIPFVGWTLQVAAVAGQTAQLAEATCQVTNCSATVNYQINATIAIAAAIGPDPRHGFPGKPGSAVWPALADTYEVTLQYEGGTSTKQTGSILGEGAELKVSFGQMPAFASFQIIVTILASNGWICGTFTSGWQAAVVPSGDKMLTVSGHITEQLAPLTADTTYSYDSSILYDSNSGSHVWTNNPSTATKMSLGGGTGGDTGLDQLTGFTTLDVTYDIGYSWLGEPLNPPLVTSGEPAQDQAYTVQNLSLLSSASEQPDSRLVTPNYVTPGSCYLAYQRYGRVPKGGAPPYNFYVDTSSGTPNLRLFDLSGAPGTFAVSPTPPSWGTFPEGVAFLDQLVILQNGIAIGVSSALNKIAVLKPKEPGSPTSPGSPAPLPPVGRLCGGKGVRQGLVNQPIALDVTPDGKALVLEAGNRRVQAFDHGGNPVASFDHHVIFESDVFDIPGALNNGTVPESLQALFQEKDPAFRLFQAEARMLGKLASGPVSKRTIQAFGDEGIIVSDGAVVSEASPTANSTNWIIKDSLCAQAYAIAHSDQKDKLNVFSAFNDTTVSVIAQGTEWVVADKGLAESYHILAGAERLVVHAYTSYFPLVQPPGPTPSYLDLATDVTGYVFVLYNINDGDDVSDYLLDIYSPEGRFLSRTNSLVGGRIALDIWRNLYTLDYRNAPGPSGPNAPSGQTEPSISQWVPSPPAGQIAYSDAIDQAFVNNDPGALTAALEGSPIKLPSSFKINTISASGHWQIIGAQGYDVILSGASQAASSMDFYFYDLDSQGESNG
jgi:hypothetical protein